MIPGLRELLIEWLPRQRWYTGKNATPQLSVTVELLDDPAARLARAVVCDNARGTAELYHVPLALHRKRAPLPDAALVGVSSAGWVYDGCFDPAYAAWLLARTARSSVQNARILTGEQSNTSIVCETVDGGGRPVVIKVFRVLADGVNPDVELQEILSRAGTARVPQFLGSVRGSWVRAGTSEAGDLAIAQEFIAGATDAWHMALDCLRTGRAFDATSLGAATAEVHRLLASACGTASATPADRAALVRTWHERAAAAAREVEEVRSHLAEAHALYERAAHVSWPPLQRVHGDFHLGQVIQAPHRGWVLLDFEGEPMRPLADRRRRDLALRDIAGMLRSFDYAAAASSSPGRSAWAHRAREEFLDGYGAEAGTDPRRHGDLLTALELDKAFYEVLYEARNRPTWIRVPLTAITGLLRSSRTPRRELAVE